MISQHILYVLPERSSLSCLENLCVEQARVIEAEAIESAMTLDNLQPFVQNDLLTAAPETHVSGRSLCSSFSMNEYNYWYLGDSTKCGQLQFGENSPVWLNLARSHNCPIRQQSQQHTVTTQARRMSSRNHTSSLSSSCQLCVFNPWLL